MFSKLAIHSKLAKYSKVAKHGKLAIFGKLAIYGQSTPCLNIALSLVDIIEKVFVSLI